MYAVRWKRTALDRLTELWLEAENRALVTEAVSQIDRTLAHNPQQVGESRSEEIRILFEPPLGAFFEVDDARQIVHVLRVWVF
jgi:plasmid stabilization system protein ParE